jgi:hypothetical protein
MKVVCVIRAKKLKLLFVSLDGKEQIAKKVKNKINNLTCSNFIIRIIKNSNKLVFEKGTYVNNAIIFIATWL